VLLSVHTFVTNEKKNTKTEKKFNSFHYGVHLFKFWIYFLKKKKKKDDTVEY